MHICQARAPDGELLKAIFAPEKGMNLMSFKKGDCEVIDPYTLPLFEERMAGLGALIGPHFHHRPDHQIDSNINLDLFPFIEALKLKKQKEFFSHGIARYVPWKYEGGENYIKGVLKGSDLYQGISLAKLEGQDFELEFQAHLLDNGLWINYSVKAEKPAVIGLHYYYRLPDNQAWVSAQVEPIYHHPKGWKKIPKNWLRSDNHLYFHVLTEQEIDWGFQPFLAADKTKIQLKTSDYLLNLSYQVYSSENSWQLYHPKQSTFVCIEPLTAKNPKEAVSLSAQLKVHLQIETTH